MAAWMGEEFAGRMDTCIRMGVSLCCPPETITTLLISYTPIQNLKKILKGRNQGFMKLADVVRGCFCP